MTAIEPEPRHFGHWAGAAALLGCLAGCGGASTYVTETYLPMHAQNPPPLAAPVADEVHLLYTHDASGGAPPPTAEGLRAGLERNGVEAGRQQNLERASGGGGMAAVAAAAIAEDTRDLQDLADRAAQDMRAVSSKGPDATLFIYLHSVINGSLRPSTFTATAHAYLLYPDGRVVDAGQMMSRHMYIGKSAPTTTPPGFVLLDPSQFAELLVPKHEGHNPNHETLVVLARWAIADLADKLEEDPT